MQVVGGLLVERIHTHINVNHHILGDYVTGAGDVGNGKMHINHDSIY